LSIKPRDVTSDGFCAEVRWNGNPAILDNEAGNGMKRLPATLPGRSGRIGVTVSRRSMRARSERIEDHATVKIIEALRDLPRVEFYTTQIDRGGLDRAVAEQDL